MRVWLTAALLCALRPMDRTSFCILKCTDVKPDAKAVVQIANVNDDIWMWLANVDPLFT